jgi:hypothetical protein
MSNPIGYLTPTFQDLAAIGKKVSLLRGILPNHILKNPLARNHHPLS